MSTETAQLIAAFEALPNEEKQAFVKEMFRRLPHEIDLRERGITEKQAADLRARLNPIADDWNRPEMDVYDAD